MGCQEDPEMLQLWGLNMGSKTELQQALQTQGDAGSSWVMVVRGGQGDGHLLVLVKSVSQM